MKSVFSKQTNPTFGKLYYQGQHAYYLHKVKDLSASADPLQEALDVAKRKGLKVLGYEVLGQGNPVILTKVKDEDGYEQDKWVPAKLMPLPKKEDGRVSFEWVPGGAHERVFLVKCMAQRS